MTEHKKINWKYTIGEILIVSVGILIAFFINNWSSNLRRVASFEEYKNGITVDLEQNLQKIDKVIKAQETKVVQLTYLLDLIESGDVKSDTIGSILFAQRKSPTFFPVKGTFRALVSQGELELFKPNLKRELFNLYDTNYERTEYNGVLYDEIYVEVYDAEIQNTIDLRTKKVLDPSTLKSPEFTKHILVIVDEAQSYLDLMQKTKAESSKVLNLIRKD